MTVKKNFSVKNYFDSRRVSNSLLGLINDPWLFRFKMLNPDSEDDDKIHFRIGSALDCLITMPEAFEDEFIIIDVNRPWGMMTKFIDNLPPNLTSDSPKEAYQEAYVASKYKLRIEKVIENFWAKEDHVNYYNATVNLDRSKSVLSKDEYELVLKLKEQLGKNKYTKKFIYPSLETECYMQFPIYFEYRGVEGKALLDGLIIDHTNKTIQPWDLKTLGKQINRFPESFIQDYYRQAGWYTIAVREWVKEQSLVIDYSDYTILPFIFVVASKLPPYGVGVFQCSEKDLECAIKGGVVKTTERKIKGIDELIDDYLWHLNTNEWEYTREASENEGKILLDVFI